jgi:CTP synthase
VTDEIKRRVHQAAQGVDLLIVETGGTVGDIESLPFLEAIRQFRADVGRENVCYVHIALVPYVATAGELKTKPVQHSVKELRAVGISPDVILCRTDRFLPRSVKQKIALFCNVDEDAVISAKDAESIYEVPLTLHDEGVDEKIVRLLNIWTGRPNLDRWQGLIEAVRHPERTVAIAMVGKYVDLTESYKSLNEALHHAAIAHRARVQIEYVDSEKLADPAPIAHADGILVPHGFGSRGVEGKIVAVRYARERRVPYFGICYGLQMAVIEFARHVAGLAGANSTEVDPETPHPVIDLLPEQRGVADKGATMRLGAWPCVLRRGTRAFEAYGTERISERHRHRYEVNPELRDELSRAGLVLAGVSPDGRLVEVIELADHPWFVGCQYHPEFKSRPFTPHPLFHAFVGAALAHQSSR